MLLLPEGQTEEILELFNRQNSSRDRGALEKEKEKITFTLVS
jgi:hypothetical protein